MRSKYFHQGMTRALRPWRPFLLLGLVLSWIFLLPGCSQPESSEKEAPIPKSTPVEVRSVTPRDLPLTVESVGRLAANREVTLAAEVGGVVKRYLADFGDRVAAGQLLMEIDPQDYQLALAEARANLASARARLEITEKTLNRSRALLPQKAISSESFDKCEAEFKSSSASLAQAGVFVAVAEERLKKTRVTAPFDGLIAERRVELGQTLQMGTPIMTLVDLKTVRVRIHIAEGDYVCVDPHDPVEVTVEAFSGRTFKGRIDRIGVKADERTNTFDVEILVDNPDLLLKAGLTARVRITTEILPGTILIPQSTVLYREDRREVFVVGPGDRAELRTIALGCAYGSDIEILNGLTPGDRLIVAGGQYLKPGDNVIIQSPQETNTP